MFFDNLSAKHSSGPITGETHYYPFGLTMAGISSQVFKKKYIPNKYKYNGASELENKEFSDGSGIDLYSTEFRKYDAQVGRFHQIDGMAYLSFEFSPYTYANNNPILLNDPLGLLADTSVSDVPVMPEVVVTPANNDQLDTENGQVLQPISRFWDFMNGPRSWQSFPGSLLQYAVDYRGYIMPNKQVVNQLTFTAPVGMNRLNLKSIFNLKNWIKGRFAVYLGKKEGIAYIGKATTIDGSLGSRYTFKEIQKLQAEVLSGLDNIPTNAIALGVEQIVIDLNGGIGSAEIANKIPATIKEIYMIEARAWLNANYPNWETLLKFQ